MLRRWAERTDTPVLDLHEAYLRLPRAERENLYHPHAAPYHGHWTDEGARVTAQLLAAELRGRSAGGTPQPAS